MAQIYSILSLRLRQEDYRNLSWLAQQLDESVASLIRRLIREAVERERQQEKGQ